jgi:hypothetical protein
MLPLVKAKKQTMLKKARGKLNYKTGGPLRESTFKKGDVFFKMYLVTNFEYSQGVKSAVLIGCVTKRITTLSVFL